MKNYQTISVVPHFTSLLDRQKPWNTQLKEYIETTGKIVIVPQSQVVLNETWCHWQVEASSVVQVTDEEFLNPRADHIPLVMGSQFGLQAGGLTSANSEILQPIVVFGKSLLSGTISGLRPGFICETGGFRHSANQIY